MSSSLLILTQFSSKGGSNRINSNNENFKNPQSAIIDIKNIESEFSSTQEEGCDEKCTCPFDINNGSSLVCKLDIVQVDSFISNLRQSVNNITLLLNWSDETPSRTKAINLTSIDRLTNLTYLALKRNPQTSTKGEIAMKAINLIIKNTTFSALTKLRTLIVNMPLSNGQRLEHMVKYSKVLETLDLCETLMIKFKYMNATIKAIHPRATLKKLLLSNFQSIGSEGFGPNLDIGKMFKGFHHLEELDISRNSFGIIQPGLNDQLPNLKRLNVSYNSIGRSMKSLNDPFYWDILAHTNLEYADIGNQGRMSQSSTREKKTLPFSKIFSCINSLSAKNISNIIPLLLNSTNPTTKCNLANCIAESAFGTNTFADIPCKIFNDFEYDKHCAFFIRFPFLQKMRKARADDLNWRVQVSYVVSGTLCLHETPLTEIRFTNNKNWVKEFKLSETLNHLSYKGINNVGLIDLTHNNLNLHLLIEKKYPQMRRVYLAGNFIQLPNTSLCKAWENLEFLNLSQNGLKRIPENVFQDCFSLENLDLSHNLITNNSINFKVNSSVPLHLDLSYNRLNQLPNANLCKAWVNLKLLNLSRNGLQSIPENAFQGCHQLQTLDLKHNSLKIYSINFRMSLVSLQHLDLSYNNLNYIIIILIQSNENSTVTLNLLGNPFICNCSKHSLNFIAWFKEINQKSVIISHKEIINCSSSHGLKPIQNIDTDYMRSSCNRSLVALIAVATVTILSIIIFFASLCVAYKYRWRIRYYLFVIKKKILTKTKRESVAQYQTNQNEWKYDIFISYCAADRFWVHDVLMKTLENTYGFKLCIHYRDFPLGEWIVDAIVSAIHSSREIIIVVSEIALKSSWLQFELKVAFSEARNRNMKIILIKLENITQPVDSPAILWILENQVHLEWSNDEDGQKLFWTKLVSLLYGDDTGGGFCCCKFGMRAVTSAQLGRGISDEGRKEEHQ